MLIIKKPVYTFAFMESVLSIFQHPRFYLTGRAALATLAGVAIAMLGSWAAGPALTPFWLAGVAALVSATTCLLPGRRSKAGIDTLAAKVGEEIDTIMIGAAETSHFVDSIRNRISGDVESTNEIAARSESTARNTEEIAANAERAAQVATMVRQESVTGRSAVDQGLKQISEARGNAQAASEVMESLQKKSRSIHGITAVITEIATRTNLLALNAAIEAARAGEHGRGFAVVAGEVRQLAQRTAEATADIGSMVTSIIAEAERASAGMSTLTDKVAQATQEVERVHASFSTIERCAADSHGEIHKIALASREHVDATRFIAAAIARIRDGMLGMQTELPRAAASALALAERAEALFEATTESNASTPHDAIRAVAQQAARDVGRLFESAIARGEITEAALFDRRYVPIPNTNPPKHRSAFDQFTDRVLPALQEALLVAMPQLAFAGAVDSNGYFPTHNKKFSQPLTGDYATDLVNNRTKRIFNDRTGARCGANTKPYLLQTYKRDTGEVMHDLSAPIYVHGKHWGGFRIGYRSASA